MLPNSLIPTALPKAQFRAVVTCGYGSDLYPLIEPLATFTDDEPDESPNAPLSSQHHHHHQRNDSQGGANATGVMGGSSSGTGAGAGTIAGLGSNNAGTSAATSASTKKPGQVKALLPVVGKKMVDWTLDRVEEAGVFGADGTRLSAYVLVLSPSSLASPIAHHLRARRTAPSTSNLPSGTPSTKIELEDVPDAVARQGSVAVLKWATEKGLIKSDILLVPCDLLLVPTTMTTISLASLIDRHRTDDNLMTTLFYERAAGAVVEARKDGPSEILTIYDSKTSTLLDIREMAEFDDDEIPLRTSLLERSVQNVGIPLFVPSTDAYFAFRLVTYNRFPSPTLSTTLLPCQVYIFSSLVFPLLTSPNNARRLSHMESLREFAGWVARLSWRNSGKDAIGYRDVRSVQREDGLAMGRSTTQAPLGFSHPSKFPFAHSPQPLSGPQTGANTPALVSRSSWLRSSISNGPNNGEWDHGLLSKAAVGGAGAGGRKNGRAATGGCKLVIWKSHDGWCGRGNTVAGYVELNRSALKLLPPQPPATNTPQGVFISPDSWLHSSVHANLGEKVGVKRSIIGRGCFVGRLTKLTNCVLMDGVHIGENCKLDNCVVSTNVQIRDRAQLKDCEIGQDYIVEADASIKNEQFVVELD
ncbi:BZ3500_MvSof-1268-A1-R1_Chr11-2g03368 [Microbotryum saponariae]|uniref:Translation initiation factor eIF2B subunit gamma n=1 Tax=Microbotryum saponariae TaxID=289078 RepID=A0A2X0KU09_9BASI|nr:BZ3500_MvSof-1268-A1-R1_Chr11-2g03368 [Microbotryum saponariae]SDA03214.1 BZ3501_MvSof-1269-A2-R1_Chr11g02939 [Microbotryum saponariae]